MDPFGRAAGLAGSGVVAPPPDPFAGFTGPATDYQSRQWTFNGGTVAPGPVAVNGYHASTIQPYNLGLPSPVAPHYDETGTIAATPPPEPGVFGSLLGGIPNIAGGIIGSAASGAPQPLQDIASFAGHIPQYLGDIVDSGINMAGSGILPQGGVGLGGRSVAQEYAALPDTAEKQAFERHLLTAPDAIARDRAMMGYLQNHEVEWAHSRGIDPQFAQAFMPATDLSGLIRNVAFGLLAAPQAIVQHELVQHGIRLGGSVMDSIVKADPNSLSDGTDSTGAQQYESLRALRQRYDAGEINYDELVTMVANSSYAMTNNPDTGLVGRIALFAQRVVTDPLVVGTGALGLAAKTVETGALARTAMTAARLLEDTRPGDYTSLVERLAQDRVTQAGKAGRALDPLTARGNVVDRVGGNELGDAIKGEHPDIWSQALSEQPGMAQALTRMSPVLNQASHLANTLVDPFHWFGVGRLAEVFSRRVVDGSISGTVAAYGVTNALRVQDMFEKLGASDRYANALSHAGANVANAMHQKSMQAEVADSGRLVVEAGAKNADGTPVTPTQAANMRRSLKGVKTLGREVEQYVRSTKRDLTPYGFEGASKAGTAEGATARTAAVESVRADAAQQVANMTGATLEQAQAAVRGMSEDSLLYIHHLYYGHAISDFLSARASGVEESAARRATAGERHAAAVEAEPAPVIPEKSAMPVEPAPGITPPSQVGSPHPGVDTPPGEAPTLASEMAPATATPATEAVAASPGLQAAQQELADATEQAGVAERYTPIGAGELTTGAAKDLQARLDAANPTEAERLARNAISQYDYLHRAVDVSLHGEALLDEVRTVLAHALEPLPEGGSRLVQAVDDLDKLPPSVRAWAERERETRGPNGYRVGIAPDDPWSVRHDEFGTPTGVHAWMDPVISNTEVRKMGNLYRVRSGLTAPIYGNRLLADARQNFTRIGMEQYGLTRGDSEKMFWALRKAQRDAPEMIGPRGLSGESMMKVAHQTFPPGSQMFNLLGTDGLTNLVLRAYEGDIKTVGVAPKVSGLIKSHLSNSLVVGRNNNLGRIAEQLYPALRFFTNPLFLMQEMLESPFWNILRGVNPGLHSTPRNTALLELIDGLRTSSDHHVDNLEYDALHLMGAARAKAMAPVDSSLSRATARISRLFPRSVREIKQRGFAEQFGHDAGLDMKAKYQKYAPGEWGKLEQHYGTTDPTMILLRSGADKGMLSESVRSRLWGLDSSIPAEFGRRSQVNLRDVASHFGMSDIPSLRTAVKNGTLSESQFKDALEFTKANPDYAHRAWLNASEPSPSERRKGISDHFVALGDSRVVANRKADATLATWTLHAEGRGQTLHQWSSETLTGQPRGFTSVGELPIESLLQSAEEFAGTIVRPDGSRVAIADPKSPEFALTRRYAQSMVGASSEEKRAAAKTDIEAVAAGHPTEFHRGERLVYGAVDGNPGVVYHPDQTPAQMLDWASGHLTDAQAREAAAWYDGVITHSYTLAQLLSDREREALMSKVRAAGIEVPAGEETAYIAAKLAAAFGASQSQASPHAGMLALTGLLDRATRGERKKVGGSGVGAVYQQSQDMMNAALNHTPIVDKEKAVVTLPGQVGPFGVGPKLYDFLDSIVGNPTRSFTGEEMAAMSGLAPAAMDVWMNRFFGRIDQNWVKLTANLLTEQQLGTRSFDNTEAWKVRRVENMHAILDDLGQAGDRTQDVEKVRLKQSTIPSGANPVDKSGQYTWALSKMNAFVDHLNAENYLGRQWNSAEAQALIWVAQQKAFGLASDGIGSLGQRTSATVSMGNPLGGIGSLRRDRVPTYEELRANSTPAEALAFTSRVANLAAADLARRIQESTGVSSLRSQGGHFGAVAGDAPGVAPGAFVHVLGGEHQIANAAERFGYYAEQPRVYTTRPPSSIETLEKVVKTNEAKADGWSNQWAHDWVVPPAPEGISADVWQHALAGWMQDAFRHNDMAEHVMMGTVDSEGRVVQRLMFLPEGWKKGELSLRELLNGDGKKVRPLVPNPEHLNALNDGSWFQKWAEQNPEYGIKAAPNVGDLGIQQEPRLVGFRIHEGGDFEAQRAEVQARMVSGKPMDPAVREIYGRGYRESADATNRPFDASDDQHRLDHGAMVEAQFQHPTVPEPIAAAHAAKQSRNTITDIHYQRDNEGTPRGAVAWNDTHQATLFLGKTADPSTLVHESFHVFARSLDESGRNVIVQHFVDANPGSPAVWSHEVEEWAARQFERYAFTGEADGPNLQGIWNHFGKWAKDSGLTDAAVAPALRKVFDSMFEKPASDIHAHYDMTQQRTAAVTRMVLRAAEEQAQRTHYFAPGRSWMERSLNHPYLGLYPMSYMWGKVLPEFARFLVTRPFGLKAPLMGMALANDLMATMQNTINQDPEARDYFDKRPHMVRYLNMLMPGTPWDMPVVAPILMRHAAELDADNASRRANGLPEKSLQLGTELDGLIQHIFGLGQAAGDFQQAVGDVMSTNSSLIQKQALTAAPTDPISAAYAPLLAQYKQAQQGQQQMPGPPPQSPVRMGPVTLPPEPAPDTGPTNVAGMSQPGNIDLNARPVVRNPDGSVSTVRSISIGVGGKEVLIPTVVDGKVVSNEEAIAHYKATGEELGVFDSVAAANAYAQTLHQAQAAQYAP